MDAAAVACWPTDTSVALVDLTGDLVSMDERGYCTIAGRLKDMIIRGGENIYPHESEQVSFADPAVADVAVVGVPRRDMEPAGCRVVRRLGHTPDSGELVAYCREHLAPHKTPRYWTVLEEFPLTPSGKVQKFILREHFLAQASEVATQARLESRPRP